MTTKTLLAVAAVALLAALVPLFAAADPGSAVQTDLTQLTSDVAAAHGTLIADFDAVTTDLQGSDKPAVRADVSKLRTDWQALIPPIRTDRQQLISDLQAARAAHVTGLAALVKSSVQADRAAIKELVQAAKQTRAAVLAFRASQHATGSS